LGLGTSPHSSIPIPQSPIPYPHNNILFKLFQK